MDAGAETLPTGSRSSENNRPGSCQAHYVGIGPPKNCCGAAGTLGEGEGGEEGCLGLKPVRRRGSCELAEVLPVVGMVGTILAPVRTVPRLAPRTAGSQQLCNCQHKGTARSAAGTAQITRVPARSVHRHARCSGR
jgi:hypothetical protein